MKTQVCIIGGGPSGLLLSQLLHRKGIESVVLERQSQAHVLSRIRAGVLERGLVNLLREAGCGARMDREGEVHHGFCISHNDALERVDLEIYADGGTVMVYGQTEVTRDLYDARAAMGGAVLHNVNDVVLHDLKSTTPHVSFEKDGVKQRIDCDFVVGADGFHGVSRPSIPDAERREFEKVYPFGWLGVLSETPPVSPEVIYGTHARGFCLCSMRSQVLSRYYIQVPLTDKPEDWSDDAFWAELKKRLPASVSDKLVTGPSIEKSIAPLRSFVCETMRYGSLFLVGDAAHIVPPTGAKGLNTAASDVHYLYHGLCDHYLNGDNAGIDGYADKALARVWKAERFSWWLTQLLHNFPQSGTFDNRMKQADFEYLFSSDAAKASLAENYAGLPY